MSPRANYNAFSFSYGYLSPGRGRRTRD